MLLLDPDNRQKVRNRNKICPYQAFLQIHLRRRQISTYGNSRYLPDNNPLIGIFKTKTVQIQCEKDRNILSLTYL